MPVIFVFRSYSAQVNWKWRIPIRKVFGLGNSWILGNIVSIRGEARNRHDFKQLEIGFLRFEPAVLLPQEIFEGNRSPRFDVEILRGPFVKDDRWRIRRFILKLWNRQFAQTCDQGIWR